MLSLKRVELFRFVKASVYLRKFLMNPSAENVKPIFERAKILVVDDAYCTRKVIHALLLAMGCHQDSRGQ